MTSVLQLDRVWIEFNFNLSHNKYTLPQLQAFFHAKHMLKMMVKYGKELESTGNVLPSGWASASMNEQKVIALYIMLEDKEFNFAEEIQKEDSETLKLLQEVLMADCKELDDEDLDLNKIGVQIVEDELKKRGKK